MGAFRPNKMMLSC